ncbi:DNA mismatch endonuclease Vsr [Bradyrhizobium sp. 168]|uniref:very short patch repair endonuclease n=1 Tax=Bradyrhizobium sp. 168 TaxID=2782639 RepID=UPI0021125149|nr:very short patch repair endonuclease [Bradyrhizobium sp. 168]MCK1580684.1 DNA mismatch endonuclease Vsr [Bradyrhizobium sp. 168]
MADRVSREKRSAMMAAVRGKNTAPEMLVRRAAHRIGLRYRLHDRRFPGRPDLVLPKWKTVIFVNGCFWHRHNGCRLTTSPKTNKSFWQRKFRDNKRRDALNYERLKVMGWRVIVLWQCEIVNVEQIANVLKLHFVGTSDPK